MNCISQIKHQTTHRNKQQQHISDGVGTHLRRLVFRREGNERFQAHTGEHALKRCSDLTLHIRIRRTLRENNEVSDPTLHKQQMSVTCAPACVMTYEKI